ncbi:MAG TPA: undecaprenyl diphosphate synthase family protein [Steroidobacteraceae bacterium]|nr:undecaprenyl diphosphate synthase family protein [Steroidobacteraceae bacterium]
MYFTATLWPDFGLDDLEAALAFYSARERRFGLTQDQLSGQAAPMKVRET